MDYAPQYTVICPECKTSNILNRGQSQTKGMLWWKKTYVPADCGTATCYNCDSKFYYDTNMNGLQNCYPTAVGISPAEAFNFGGGGSG